VVTFSGQPPPRTRRSRFLFCRLQSNRVPSPEFVPLTVHDTSGSPPSNWLKAHFAVCTRIPFPPRLLNGAIRKRLPKCHNHDQSSPNAAASPFHNPLGSSVLPPPVHSFSFSSRKPLSRSQVEGRRVIISRLPLHDRSRKFLCLPGFMVLVFPAAFPPSRHAVKFEGWLYLC